jgi:hypothetical protein
MVLVKAVTLGAIVLSIACATAHAGDAAPAAPAGQAQVAPTNPTIPYSYTRLPGPKAGPSNWIPSSTPHQASPNYNGNTGPNLFPQKSAGPQPQ